MFFVYSRAVDMVILGGTGNHRKWRPIKKNNAYIRKHGKEYRDL